MESEHTLLELPLPDGGRPRVVWGRLYGGATGLAVAEALARHRGPVCVVARSAAAAEQLERELAFFAGSGAVERFPDYETLPYEAISPPQDLLAERLGRLYRLAAGEPVRLLVNADALLGRLPPPEFVLSRALEFHSGQTVDRQALTAQLTERGYLRVEQVAEHGEFAVRGALIDIYPTGAADPIRIDFFDNEIDTLRTFDPHTQISQGHSDAIRVLPAREFAFDAAAIRAFRQRFRDRFPGEPGRCPLYRDISDALLPAGIEYYLPLFFDRTASLADYLPAGTLVVLLEGAAEGLDGGWSLIEERYEQLAPDAERPILRPEDAFVPPAELLGSLDAYPQLELRSKDTGTRGGIPVHAADAAYPLSSAAPALDRISRWLDAPTGERTLLLASSPGRREMLIELLRGRGYTPQSVAGWNAFVGGDAPLAIGVGELEAGLKLPSRRLRVVTAAEIGMERPRQRARRRRAARDPEALIRELNDLQIGAPVVHEEYGIGRYQGLATLVVDGVPTEFLLLEYADEDKLYVPVHSLHLVTRYSGAPPEQAPLHRLGSDQWAKAKRKAAQQARDVAAELLNLYARRAARSGTSLAARDENYQRFAMEFPFEETEDQLSAIGQVLDDMAAGRPMDRIVCGDVGFGKTEVALRASFVATYAGFQVAVLVPTTLLAQQHYRTFSDRFADWPVEVELLSRFRNTKETRQILERLADGHVDIVIGTHKLLQPDVKFKNLGLVIIDEEHRFGVKHKEQLKRLRAEVDVLTMTATPIPRTLNMTLGGLRDLSIIATPPAERLAIKTFVGEWTNRGIREAVLREIRRGGQVYFVHNRVENIEQIADKLRGLLPETSIRVAHGQMSEKNLESVMLDFYHRRFSVLVCTTIIESGIDIPTANTIIVNRADRLGLAQLHQLRGRVGRSHHQAYAYLIAPPLRALSADAAKRLEAISALEELGSGFTLATHDLEIRGAGELLGEGQSGQIQAIGFTLYNELLGRAVRELREGREPNLEDPFTHGPQIETGLPALIPEDYLPDVHMRLVHYKRIAGAESEQDLEELKVELIDRFGPLPDQIRNLFAVTRLKLNAQRLGIAKVQAGSKRGVLVFGDRAAVDPVALVGLVEDEPERFSLDGPYKLRFTLQDTAESDRIAAVERLLDMLSAKSDRSVAA
jgi:transcription-repair coupling factor (superfamily II helicase)